MLQLPRGKRASNQGKAILGHTLQLAHNRFGLKQITINDGNLYLAYDDGCEETLAMGYQNWQYGTLNGYPYYSIKAINRMQGFKHAFTAATAYAWTSKATLEVRVHYVDWISGLKFVFDLTKQEVTVCDTYPNSKPETIHYTLQ